MRRLLVVLGLLVATALLVVMAFVLTADPDGVVPEPERRPEVPAPAPQPLRPEPRHAEKAKPADAKVIRADPIPPQPVAQGRLVCFVGTQSRSKRSKVEVPKAEALAAECRLTVLWPGGEEIATKSTTGWNEEVQFASLPQGVPLVLRVSKPGWLTGCCCDVVLPAQGALEKKIGLIPAPEFGVRVLELPGRREVRDCRVELWQGDKIVAVGSPTRRDELWMTVSATGLLRAKVTNAKGVLLADVPVHVWPLEEPPVQEICVTRPGSVEVVVLTADGKPATRVQVWLVGEFARRPPVTTDQGGMATFEGVQSGAALAAVARASDGTVARVELKTEAGATQRVPLLLAKPSPVTGDVVDEGGSAIRDAVIEVVVRPFDEPVVATSDDTGAFATPPLPAGVAQVVVRREGYLDWRPDTPVVVSPGTGATFRARLHRAPAGALVVAVRDESGRPLAGATVAIYPSRRTAKTAADGMCRFNSLPAGVDQTAFAKRRGYRTRAEAAANPPVVRVVQDTAVEAEIVLRPSGAVPKHGDVGVTGTVLDPANLPVVGVRVECGTAFAFAALDGTFRLDGLSATTPGEPVELRIQPGPGLLQRFQVLLDIDDVESVDLGAVRLRARPYARIVAPRDDDSLRRGTSSTTFWLSCNHGETLLGGSTGRFEPIACVSYDGTWLHLPPADDWRIDGRGEVFVAFPIRHGLRTATAVWTLTPDAAVTLRPEFTAAPARVFVSNGTGKNRDTLLFSQLACSTLFDPKSIHVPTGNLQAPVDPFASIAAARWFTIENAGSSASVEDLAPGTWRVGLRDDGASAEFKVPGDTTVIVRR